ncbi:hypothetical protein N9S30_00150 [bacterium]|nr:hypothetical protein [bacterium]
MMMLKNQEMMDQMKSEGYGADDTRFIRGYKSADADTVSTWLAIKESQNFVVSGDTVDMWMNSTHGGAKYVQFKASEPGTVKFHLWVQRVPNQKSKDKRWTRMGVYQLDTIRKQTHHVTKRNKPYTTDIARLAKKVK